MLKRFSQAIERIEGQIRNWSAPSSDVPSDLRYLVAVSGGVDSMCLADLCLKNLGTSRFAVAHCNFHLRGEESDGDEALVASWASSNGVEVFKADFDTETYAACNSVSIEMAARDLRYGWFAELCKKHGFAGVMTAHNANDNAETLILNLLRGSGVSGICGMDEISFSAEGCVILRPILACTRKQIEGYAFAWKIPYRTDSTNALSDYKRNRIRNEVFPQFEKVNPSFVQTLNREMKYFSEAADIVEDWCREHVAGCLSSPDDRSGLRHPGELIGVRISISALLSEPRWRYLLYYILSPYGFNSAVLASVEDLLMSDRTVSGKRFESDAHFLLAERDELVVVEKQNKDLVVLRPDHPFCLQSDSHIMTVRGTGVYHFNGSSFTVELLPWTSDMSLKQPEGTLIMDADKLPFPFVCRRWNIGDWFKPLGLKGKKKVSDLFTDLKYDTFEKDAALMIVDCRGDLAEEQHVAGVMGVRIDDGYKVTSKTKHILKMKLQ